MESRNKSPQWAKDHFTESLDSIENLLRVIHISERGIGVLRAMPNAIKVLSKADALMDESRPARLSPKRLEIAEREAELARSEIAKEFPVLHSLAVVGLWSWLEHFVKGLMSLWILHRRDALSAPTLQKVRVRLGDYLQLKKHEQCGYLVELLEQELASPLKRGVTRFESLLGEFGLDGPVPEECSKSLFELQQVRNAVAHRNGRADRRLRSECPWLKVRLNQPIKISQAMLGQYANASVEYLIELTYRVGDVYGCDLRNKDDPNKVIQATREDPRA